MSVWQTLIVRVHRKYWWCQNLTCIGDEPRTTDGRGKTLVGFVSFFHTASPLCLSATLHFVHVLVHGRSFISNQEVYLRGYELSLGTFKQCNFFILGWSTG